MAVKHLSLLAGASLFGLLVQTGLPTQALAQAVALTGQVTSAEEGLMEGVVVSAKKQGSTVTVSVVTDAKGQYSFPADRLSPGQYAIAIRAAGYDLDGAKTADVVAGGSKADRRNPCRPPGRSGPSLAPSTRPTSEGSSTATSSRPTSS